VTGLFRLGLSGGVGLLFCGVTAAPAAPAAGCPCPCPAANPASLPAGAQAVVPPPPPDPAAFALNRAGRDLYRQRHWDDARQSYRAAIAADPGFLAPRLNIACSFAQEERFGEAVAAARDLLAAGFVPWSREIEEAADLAPLRTRPEQAALRAAIVSAGQAWGADIAHALLFVARTGPPVKLADSGTSVLSLAQEIFAYLPEIGAFRQVTAEDGRVLAMSISGSGVGKAVIWVRAGKLVRLPGRPPFLRGLALRRLDLPGMTLGPPIAIPGDVARLEMSSEPAGVAVVLTAPETGARTAWRFDGHTLLAVPTGRATGRPDPSTTVVLGPTGVSPAVRPAPVVPPPCAFTARDAAAAKGGVPAVRIAVPGRAPFILPTPHGAALHGLPFPVTRSAP
jgi:hypothetical protein